MSYSYQIDGEHKVVLFRAAGVFTIQEMMSCLREVVADPQFEPDFDHLIDFRSVTHFEAGGEEMRERVRDDQRLEEQIGSGRIALVAEGGHVFGMARMYEIMMEDDPRSVATFNSITDAATWLEVPKAVVDQA